MALLGLWEMEEGETGVVVGNHGHTDGASRLAELGLVPGEHIHVIQSGAPMLVQIGGSRLCLRSEEMADIAVLPLQESSL